MKWGAAQGRKIRQELFDCYKNQDWFSFVGTQFDKQLLSAETTRQKLGLPNDKKIAVIFPHILWMDLSSMAKTFSAITPSGFSIPSAPPAKIASSTGSSNYIRPMW